MFVVIITNFQRVCLNIKGELCSNRQLIIIALHMCISLVKILFKLSVRVVCAMRRVKMCGGQTLLLCEWYHLPPGYKHLDYVAIVTCQRGSRNRDEHEVNGHVKI